MKRACAVAAICALFAGHAVAATKQPAPWQVTITQVDSSGKAMTDAVNISCPPSGCEKVLSLYVNFQPRQFIAAVTFVDKGAYVELQPLAKEVGQVIGFEEGYKGPVFVKVRADEKDKIQLLRFTLTGPMAPEAGNGGAAMMSNPQSLVFHRKLEPDLSLQIELVRPAAAS